jgi:thioredoxin reductase (NADPH)
MVDIIIVGGGASGMTAAVYALRSGKSVLILEKETFGGQIATSPRLENFPSIKDISGIDFSNNLFEQATSLGVGFELEDVTKIDKLEDGFNVTTNYHTYKCKAVIIASGVKHRTLGVAREEELIGKGVSYCATCDGAFYKGQDVVLIGDANTALQYALALSNICKSVTIVTLFDRFFAEDIMIKRIKERKNIAYFHNYALQEYIGKKELEALRFKNTKTSEEKIIKTTAAFIAIGQIPDNERFSNLVDLDKGYIVTNEKMETKTKGVYAAGDCRIKQIRQLTTAVGDATIAAVNATNYIDTNY